VNPEKVTYASAGTGSSNHLSGLLFSRLTGVKMTHVPYKGGGPLMTDLLGGHVNMVFGTLPLYGEHVRSGKLKVIATLAKTRIPQFPDVPAAAETVPGFEAKTWFGLFAPAGTPRDVLARLHREILATLADTKVKETLTSRGFDITASSPEFFTAFLKQESELGKPRARRRHQARVIYYPHARAQANLRTLQQGAASRLPGSAHLHLRVHLLRHVRGKRPGQCLPEPRRWVCSPPGKALQEQEGR
jgi:hypothetical protein